MLRSTVSIKLTVLFSRAISLYHKTEREKYVSYRYQRLTGTGGLVNPRVIWPPFQMISNVTKPPGPLSDPSWSGLARWGKPLDSAQLELVTWWSAQLAATVTAAGRWSRGACVRALHLNFPPSLAYIWTCFCFWICICIFICSGIVQLFQSICTFVKSTSWKKTIIKSEYCSSTTVDQLQKWRP